MKKILFYLCATILAAGFNSCGKVSGPAADDGTGSLHVTLGFDGLATKAVTPTSDEMTVNSLRIYVFDADGMLDVVHDCSAAEITSMSLSLQVKTGQKTVVAVANLRFGALTDANAVITLQALRSIASDLSMEAPTSLLMYGEQTVTVSVGGTNSAAVEMVRRVGRVNLKSVKNSLPAVYGNISIRRAFLCDVYARTFLGGPDSAQGSGWYNTAGTNDDGEFHVLYSNSAYICRNPIVEKTTVRHMNQSVPNGQTNSFTNVSFYGYQNTRTEANNGFSSPYTPKATTLMVEVLIAGKVYYYPVSLTGGFLANTTYDIDLTIIGLGNTVEHAYDRIEKASLAVTVSIAGWDSGTGITEEI